jgi:hypothetical protein
MPTKASCQHGERYYVENKNWRLKMLNARRNRQKLSRHGSCGSLETPLRLDSIMTSTPGGEETGEDSREGRTGEHQGI